MQSVHRKPLLRERLLTSSNSILTIRDHCLCWNGVYPRPSLWESSTIMSTILQLTWPLRLWLRILYPASLILLLRHFRRASWRALSAPCIDLRYTATSSGALLTRFSVFEGDGFSFSFLLGRTNKWLASTTILSVSWLQVLALLKSITCASLTDLSFNSLWRRFWERS